MAKNDAPATPTPAEDPPSAPIENATPAPVKVRATPVRKPVELVVSFSLVDRDGNAVDVAPGTRVCVTGITKDIAMLGRAAVDGNQPKGLMALVVVPKS